MVAVVSALLVAGCGRAGDPAGEEPEGPLVVCTTTMIADLARRIAGPDTRVAGIMKPGTDPHTYEPKPDDGILFRRADLIFVNGLHLEGNMMGMIANVGKKAVPLAEHPSFQVRAGGGGAPDPHLWWDASYFAVYAEQVRDRLAELRPDRAEEIRRRAEALVAELQELHRRTQEAFAAIPAGQRLMVTSHDAFYYFGRAYGVEVDAVLGISTDAQARAAEPLRLATLVAQRKVPAVFHETSVSAAQNNLVDSIQRLAERKFGHTVRIAGPLYSDSLDEPGKPAGSYAGAFKYNVRTILTALTGQPAPEYFAQ